MRGAQPPLPGPWDSGGGDGRRTCSAPLGRAYRRAGGFTHLAPRARHGATPRTPPHRRAGATRLRKDPAEPRPPPPGQSSGRPQRTCCAACHGFWALRRRRLSPTTTWRPRPPQEAGGRGGERRAGSDGQPARPPSRGAPTPHRGERDTAWRSSSPPGPRKAWAEVLLLPRGPEAPRLTALPGAAKTHLAPPLRGDLRRLGGTFPAGP